MYKAIALVGVLAAPALAAAPPTAPPSDLFAVVDVAAPKLELPDWARVVARFSPGTPLPPPESIGTWLGKLIGVQSIDGVDPAQPLHLALVNPQTYPQPLVLVLPVKDPKALAASLKSSPYEAHIIGAQAVVGAKATLTPLEKAIVAATRTAPEHGLHATAFLPPIWAVYGPQLRGVLAVAMQSQGGTGGFQQAMGKVGGMLIGALDQSERMLIDLGADGGIPGLTFTLEARAGTPMAGVFAAQKPCDFSLLPRFPVVTAPIVMAGFTDMKSMSGWFADVTSGNEADTREMKEIFDQLAEVLTGEFAMLGQAGSQTESDYVMRVTDPKRVMTLFPRMYEIFARTGMFGSKVIFKAKPGARIGNIVVKRTEATYDFSKIPGYQGPPKVKTELAQAGWDDMFGSVSGTAALERLKKLVTASRAQPPATLDPSLQADVDKARAAQDSVFMRMDLQKVAAEQKGFLPAGTTLILRVGFSATSGRFRFLLGQMPSSTGTSATSEKTPK